MKLLTAFFRLVRWLNLIFIVLTQSLFYYCIIVPVLPATYSKLDHFLTPASFWWLVLASVLIAAAGYIINDYFDIDIDRVNKPDQVIIGKYISRRWAMVWHWVLTTTGVCISGYVAAKTNMVVALGNIACTLLLWVYSTTFKKKLLSGNVIIASLTAWTLLVLYFATNTTYKYMLRDTGFQLDPAVFSAMSRIYKLVVLFAGFAFIATLIREVVKDMEDMEGDGRYGCKTMPIVWGIQAAKVYAGVWLIVLSSAAIIVGFYLLHLGKWLNAGYCFLLLIPCGWLLRNLYAAQYAKDYHRLSTGVKLLMLGGILAIVFLRF